MVKPKKHLGQHFLKDQNIARKIVDSLSDQPKKIIEIGPGTGVLTRFLYDKYENLSVLEIDDESVAYLSEHFPGLDIHHADFLKFNLSIFFTENVAVIGNFPYNISSQIFFKILEHRNHVDEVVCMIQKEVAQRIASSEGSKEYGILSVLLQAFYDIKYLFTVNEGVFIPPPKVKSAVIKLTRNNKTNLACNEGLFFRVVKTSFNQRRKTLRNSLKSILLNLTIEPDLLGKRPEQLNVQEFILLTRQIEKQLDGK